MIWGVYKIIRVYMHIHVYVYMCIYNMRQIPSSQFAANEYVHRVI
jgi:hypothetical protein